VFKTCGFLTVTLKKVYMMMEFLYSPMASTYDRNEAHKKLTCL